MSVLKQETGAENCGASIMNTRADIIMTALATLCIVASQLFGSLMLIDSVEHGQRSLGQLPVNVDSVQAHGLTVPGRAHVNTALVFE
jgi:hypothetical protein